MASLQPLLSSLLHYNTRRTHALVVVCRHYAAALLVDIHGFHFIFRPVGGLQFSTTGHCSWRSHMHVERALPVRQSVRLLHPHNSVRTVRG